jgi:hypothetical protein
MRNSGNVLRNAFATTSSDDGMPGELATLEMIEPLTKENARWRFSPRSILRLDRCAEPSARPTVVLSRLPSLSPPREQTAAREDEAGQAAADDRAGDTKFRHRSEGSAN